MDKVNLDQINGTLVKTFGTMFIIVFAASVTLTVYNTYLQIKLNRRQLKSIQ